MINICQRQFLPAPKSSWLCPLIDARNKVLKDFINHLSPPQNECQGNSPDRHLFFALEAVDFLYRFSNLTEKGLVRTGKSLAVELLTYFTEYSPSKPLFSDIEDVTFLYLQYRYLTANFTDENHTSLYASYQHSKTGIDKSHIKRIKEIFIRQSDGEINWLDAVQKLQPSANSLCLTDNDLQIWKSQSVCFPQEDSVIKNIATYFINRLLLQAFLLPMAEWSVNYASYLLEITGRLLQIERHSPDGVYVLLLESSYPKNLLTILALYAFLAVSPLIGQDLKCRLAPVMWERLTQYEWDPLYILLSFPITKLNTEDRTQILIALQEELRMRIKDKAQLQQFLELSSDKLTVDQRKIILSAVPKEWVNFSDAAALSQFGFLQSLQDPSEAREVEPEKMSLEPIAEFARR